MKVWLRTPGGSDRKQRNPGCCGCEVAEGSGHAGHVHGVEGAIALGHALGAGGEGGSCGRGGGSNWEAATAAGSDQTEEKKN